MRGLADAVAAQDRRDLGVEAIAIAALALLALLCGLRLLRRRAHLGNRAGGLPGGDGRRAGLLADFLAFAAFLAGAADRLRGHRGADRSEATIRPAGVYAPRCSRTCGCDQQGERETSILLELEHFKHSFRD